MRSITAATGDQRYIFLQTKANNKRKKRRGKKTHKHTLPIRERAMHILITGKIKDYTHPREVDPFWDIIYRQYEHLVYSDLYLRSVIKQYCRDEINWDSSSLEVLQKTLEIVHSRKIGLLTYLTNFMFIMYGSVMRSRFYGWLQYSQKFTSKFNEVTMNLLYRLKFDANKTRCSVYYYQAFWLCGLSIISEIRKDLTTTCSLDVDMDRGTLTTPINEKAEIKKRIPGVVNPLDSLYGNNPDDSKEKIKWSADDDKPKVKEISTTNNNTEEDPEKLLIQQENEAVDKQLKARKIIDDLLSQIGLSTDSLYRSTERSLLEIGRFLKRKINKKNIVFKEEDLVFLREQYMEGNL